MLFEKLYFTVQNAPDVLRKMNDFFGMGAALSVTQETVDYTTGKTSKPEWEPFYLVGCATLSWVRSYPLILITVETQFDDGVNFGLSITSHAQCPPSKPANESVLGLPVIIFAGQWMKIIAPDYRGKKITLEFICFDLHKQE